MEAVSSPVKRSFDSCDSLTRENKRQCRREAPTTPSPSKQLKPQFTPNTQRTYQLFKKATEVPSPAAREGFLRVREARDSIDSENPKDAIFVSPFKGFPATVVTGESVEVLDGFSGQGVQSCVARTLMLDPVFRSPKKGLVKMGDTRYSPQKKIYDRCEGSRGLDPIYRTAKTRGRNGRDPQFLAFGKPSIGDITKFDWEASADPAGEMANIFVGCVRGLWLMHRKNVLHRDIKGQNLLFDRVEEEYCGSVTDYGGSKHIPAPQRSRIRGTLEYLPSFVFDTILDQRIVEEDRIRSYGTQTKEADVFSLGYTLQKDFLYRALGFLVKKYEIAVEWVPPYTKKSGPFTDAQLMAEDYNHPGKVLYHRSKDVDPEYLMLFASREAIRDCTLEVIEKLRGELDSKSLETFRRLTSLAHEMQNPDSDHIPNISEVYKTMKKIIHHHVD